MARRTKDFREVFTRLGVPQATCPTYAETGTYLGASVISAANAGFLTVFTVELSEECYRRAQEYLVSKRRVEGKQRAKNLVVYSSLTGKPPHEYHFYFGDSRRLIRQLCLYAVKGPTFWHLDAHYCKGPTAPNAFPLWKELAHVRERPCSDIITVDDVHTFGKRRDDFAGNDDPANWEGVTVERILRYMGPRISAHFIANDMLVMLKEAAT